MLERVDLVRDGGEAEGLREHVVYSWYPEYADDIGAVRAIVLCVCGLSKVAVSVNGEEHRAGLFVAALDLEEFVLRRMSAWAN